MNEQRLRQVVKEAVKEELLGANLVDGPTHLAHHQEIENLIQLKKHAEKTGIATVIVGLIGLTVLGIWAWINGQKL